MTDTEQASRKTVTVIPDNANRCFCTHPYVQVYPSIEIKVGTPHAPPPTAFCLLCGTRGFMDKYKVKRLGRSDVQYHFNSDTPSDFSSTVIRLSTKEELEEAQKKSISDIIKEVSTSTQ